jgi:hypothetical protein
MKRNVSLSITSASALQKWPGQILQEVVWHSRGLEFPGWDITSFDEEGEPFYIEVKSSVGRDVSSVCFTANEWNTALDSKISDRYWIYIVTEALSSRPRIERLNNPARFVHQKELQCDRSFLS